ncbi:MAG: DUF4317 domain-containing protein [Ruminococcaceae bacterium]|nr:DUF4317 domain-containing protein [Oscillospiraceae bacterium]
MNEKEIAEIRRRFRPDKTNISKIRGCYVNESHEIVTDFYESLGLISPEQTEDILARLKKILSGTQGKNLIDIEFSTQQVLESEEHKLLTTLRKSGLSDDTAIKEFYEKVRSSVILEGAYLILLANDTYDVPSFSKDGEKEDESREIFSYFVCAICPVKLTKAALGYHAHEKKFCNIRPDWAVGAPELGFMFPAFDDRTANIYQSLYYTRNVSDSQEAFVQTLFGTETPPMPATEQKETFQSILSESIGEDCNMNIVKAVHSEITEMIEEHKNTKNPEPLTLKKENVKDVLTACSVPEEKIRSFEERFDEVFGEDTEISAVNLANKQIEVSTADVSIKVNGERGDLIRTRIIDGVKYILIRADDSVEVNGVKISINQ